MFKLKVGAAVLLSWVCSAVHAMPVYIVDPGAAGENVDGVRIPVATGVNLADALSASIMFSDGKFAITPDRYQISIGFTAPGIQDGLGSSVFHPLEQIGEDGEVFRIALSNGNGFGALPRVTYSWGTSSPPSGTTILGGVNLYGFNWSISPNVIGALPELVDIDIGLSDLTTDFGEDGAIIVGGGPTEVPSTAPLSLLLVGLIGVAGIRREFFRKP